MSPDAGSRGWRSDDVRSAGRQRDVWATGRVAPVPSLPVLPRCSHGPGTDAQELPRGTRGAVAGQGSPSVAGKQAAPSHLQRGGRIGEEAWKSSPREKSVQRQLAGERLWGNRDEACGSG